MTDDQAARYLRLLGIEARPPSHAALAELVAAHLARVPFENVTKLLAHGRGQAPGTPACDRFLDGVEHANLGGTCFACGFHVHDLLVHLGYDVSLCGAAMARPDVHVVNVVRLDGREWLVDVGYGAPLTAPLPLDADEPVTAAVLGRDRWVLRPNDGGRAWVEHERDGEVVHGYAVDPTPRERAHFAGAIADSFAPEAEFLTRLRIVSHRPERSVLVRDRRVTVVSEGIARVKELNGAAEVAGVVEALVGVPAQMTREAIGFLAGRETR